MPHFFAERTDLTEALNQYEVGLNNFQKAPEEENIAGRAMAFTFGALEMPALNLKAKM